MSKRWLTICLCLVPAAWGQRLYFGVVGGTGLTSNFPTTDVSAPPDDFGNPANRFQFLTGHRSFIFGGLAELRLTDGFALEANVLMRPMKDKVVFTQFYPDGTTRRTANEDIGVKAWEFPVLLKYTLRGDRRWRPFVEAGPSFRTQEDAGATEPSQFGLTAGVGAAIHFGRLRIAPTVRYTRWDHESIAPKYVTKQDQVEFLTSIAYETEPGSRRLGSRTLSIGALAGFSFLHGFGSDYFGSGTGERLRYLAGLTTEIQAAGRFSVEVDGIYRPLNGVYRESYGQSHFSVLTWEIPVLAKYRWSRPRLTPFAEAGPSFRLSGNLNGYNPSHYGITAGAGVETRAHGIRFAPTVRYTRWAADRSPYSAYTGYYYERTNPNSLQAIFAVSF